MSKKCEFVNFKIDERTIKSQFIVYRDFESNLVQENNWQQNQEESYWKRYQKHIPCSYELVCVDDQLSKFF